MFSAHLVHSDRINVKAGGLQTTRSFLLCALGILRLHKNVVDVRLHKNDFDRFIAQVYFNQVVEELIVKAKQWLVSPLYTRQERGRWLVELLNGKEIDQHPDYKAYRYLLQDATGDTPVMRLHLQALELVAFQSRTLMRMCKKATVTESLLDSITEDSSRYVTRFEEQPGSKTVGGSLSRAS